jgi:preprotein translocase subunit SecB
VLKITVTASLDGKDMFLVEVQQAGLFEITAEDPKQREILVQVGCPHTLLPFAREELASLVSKGGYQQMLIAPVNFETIYLKKLEQEESTKPPQEAH